MRAFLLASFLLCFSSVTMAATKHHRHNVQHIHHVHHHHHTKHHYHRHHRRHHHHHRGAVVMRPQVVVGVPVSRHPNIMVMIGL